MAKSKVVGALPAYTLSSQMMFFIILVIAEVETKKDLSLSYSQAGDGS